MALFLSLKAIRKCACVTCYAREEGSIPSKVTNRSYFYFVVVGYYLNGNGGRKKTHGLLPFPKTRKK